MCADTHPFSMGSTVTGLDLFFLVLVWSLSSLSQSLISFPWIFLFRWYHLGWYPLLHCLSLFSPLIYMYICFRVWCRRSDFLSPCLSSFCFFSSLGEPFSPSLIRIKSAGQILPSHSLSSTRCHPLSPLIDIFSLGKTNFFIRFSSSWSHCFLLYCDHFRKSQSWNERNGTCIHDKQEGWWTKLWINYFVFYMAWHHIRVPFCCIQWNVIS
jgi:hypothetical protein